MSTDLPSVKRDLQHAEMAAEDRKWDQVEPRVAKVTASLASLPPADAAPLLARVEALRERAQAAIRAEKSESIARMIRRNLSGIDPESQAADRVASQLQRVTDMLDDEDARAYLEPEVAAEFRRRIAELRGDSASDGRRRAIEDLTPIVAHLEEALAASPFTGLAADEAGKIARDLNARIRGGRGIIERQPRHDELDAFGASLTALEQQLEGHWRTWERDLAVGRIEESWRLAHAEIAGWADEPDAMTWERYSFDLELPRTAAALRRSATWLNEETLIAEDRATHAGDPTVQRIVAEARDVHAGAAARLHAAFERLLAEAEAAPTATEHHELEKTSRLAGNVDRWFEGTPYLEANVARAKALHARWKDAVDELDRLGKELYDRLAADAEATWRRIVADIPSDIEFNPADTSRRSRLIRIERFYNRARWDFDGSQAVAVRIHGVPVAGDYAPGIGEALADASRRTRQPISQHIEWDAIAVVEGPGTVKVRTETELRVKDTDAKIKVESWEPEPSLKIRIIALHAGPVAIAVPA